MYHLPKDINGVLVTKVFRSSPAHESLEIHDIILSIDGSSIGNDGTIAFRHSERYSNFNTFSFFFFGFNFPQQEGGSLFFCAHAYGHIYTGVYNIILYTRERERSIKQWKPKTLFPDYLSNMPYRRSSLEIILNFVCGVMVGSWLSMSRFFSPRKIKKKTKKKKTS